MKKFLLILSLIIAFTGTFSAMDVMADNTDRVEEVLTVQEMTVSGNQVEEGIPTLYWGEILHSFTYDGDWSKDYIGIVVYGENLNESTAPVLYGDEEKQIALTDGKVYQYEKTETGAPVYLLKKNDNFDNAVVEASERLYVAVEGGRLLVDNVDNNPVYNSDLAADCSLSLYPKVTGIYRGEYHDNSSYKALRIYLSSDIVSEGDIVNVSSTDNIDSTVKKHTEDKAQVISDANGNLLVQLKEDSNTYKAIKANNYYTVMVSKGNKTYSGYIRKIGENNDIVQYGSNLKIGSDLKWEIHGIGDVSRKIFSGRTTTAGSVLTQTQLKTLAQYGMVRVCTQTEDGTISQFMFCLKADISRYYDITYVLNGGVNNGANPEFYSAGKITKLYGPTRNGYAFGGWYLDEALTTPLKSNTISAEMSGNITVYAKWIAGNFKVQFDKNTANSGKMSELSLSINSGVKIPANKFVKKGYRFLGWTPVKQPVLKSTETYSGTIIADEAPVSDVLQAIEIVPNQTYTLYALWKESPYTITFKSYVNGQYEVAARPMEYVYGQKAYAALPTGTRAYYQFEGWYLDPTLKKAFKKITKTTYGDFTLYAKWSRSYDIVYHYGDDKNTVKRVKYKYEKSAIVPSVSQKKTGYAFGGFTTDQSKTELHGYTVEAEYPEKSILFQPDELITEHGVIGADGSVTIHMYGVWQDQFLVYYHTNGGILEKATTVKDVYTNYYVYGRKDYRWKIATKDNVEFVGWYSDPGLTKKAPAYSKTTRGVKHLYAKWKGADYKVEYYTSLKAITDGNRPIATQKLSYGGNQTLKKNKLSATGYTFAGWQVYGIQAVLDNQIILKDQASQSSIDDTKINGNELITWTTGSNGKKTGVIKVFSVWNLAQ